MPSQVKIAEPYSMKTGDFSECPFIKLHYKFHLTAREIAKLLYYQAPLQNYSTDGFRANFRDTDLFPVDSFC
jgi:hypothetical protein